MKNITSKLAAMAYRPPERTETLRGVSSANLEARVNDLETENTRLVKELEQVKHERDAAIADMERLQGLICQVCKEYYQPDPESREYSCRVYGDYFGEIAEDGLLCCSEFKWRGVQEEKNAE